MLIDPRNRIQDLCAKAMAVTEADQIEPLLSELRSALQDKIQGGETWLALCERAAVEQDPKKLLELVSEINRLFDARQKRPLGTPRNGSPAK
jgi:hypothetical protein